MNAPTQEIDQDLLDRYADYRAAGGTFTFHTWLADGARSYGRPA